MARLYSGILGAVAFAAVLTRGLVHGGDLGPTLREALFSLAIFGVAGCIIGGIAGWIVDESVQARVLGELKTDRGGN